MHQLGRGDFVQHRRGGPEQPADFFVGFPGKNFRRRRHRFPFQQIRVEGVAPAGVTAAVAYGGNAAEAVGANFVHPAGGFADRPADALPILAGEVAFAHGAAGQIANEHEIPVDDGFGQVHGQNFGGGYAPLGQQVVYLGLGFH